MPDLFLIFTLIVLGFIFLVLEIFVIPGFGIMGILGFLCLGGASYLSYTKLNLWAGVVVTVLSVTTVVVLIKIFPKTPFWKSMRLDKTTAGYSSTREGLNDLIGKEGRTITDLRPVGTALINNSRVDVVAEMGTISKDKDIVVIKVEGNRVVVKRRV